MLRGSWFLRTIWSFFQKFPFKYCIIHAVYQMILLRLSPLIHRMVLVRIHWNPKTSNPKKKTFTSNPLTLNHKNCELLNPIAWTLKTLNCIRRTIPRRSSFAFCAQSCGANCTRANPSSGRFSLWTSPLTTPTGSPLLRRCKGKFRAFRVKGFGLRVKGKGFFYCEFFFLFSLNHSLDRHKSVDYY